MCVLGEGWHSSHQQAVVRHWLGILQFNSVLTLPGNVIRFFRLRAQSYKTSFYFRWQLEFVVFCVSNLLEVPKTPSLALICSSGFQNWEKHFTWSPMYLKGHIIQEHPDGRAAEGRIWGKFAKILLSPSVPPFQISMFTSPEVTFPLPLGFYGAFFI